MPATTVAVDVKRIIKPMAIYLFFYAILRTFIVGTNVRDYRHELSPFPGEYAKLDDSLVSSRHRIGNFQNGAAPLLIEGVCRWPALGIPRATLSTAFCKHPEGFFGQRALNCKSAQGTKQRTHLSIFWHGI